MLRLVGRGLGLEALADSGGVSGDSEQLLAGLEVEIKMPPTLRLLVCEPEASEPRELRDPLVAVDEHLDTLQELQEVEVCKSSDPIEGEEVLLHEDLHLLPLSVPEVVDHVRRDLLEEDGSDRLQNFLVREHGDPRALLLEPSLRVLDDRVEGTWHSHRNPPGLFDVFLGGGRSCLGLLLCSLSSSHVRQVALHRLLRPHRHPTALAHFVQTFVRPQFQRDSFLSFILNSSCSLVVKFL
mmetsp:Transcript_21744/g.71926  ORF Transcript_21744/g.71926 Transcript_21744/m.71926 type:complete len:239 (-) Transcript_21744:977-1693(-)